jgi:hypothetical protein
MLSASAMKMTSAPEAPACFSASILLMTSSVPDRNTFTLMFGFFALNALTMAATSVSGCEV